MKKLLALVLALVMTLSLATVSTNAAFEDAADISYEEAADVLSAVGVFVGDGKNFNPKAALNREQAAKLVAYLALGEDVAEALPAVQMFDDVAASSWAAKYIAYCADAGIITGDGAGKFFPSAPVDGYAFSKMLLCALGYVAEAEGYVGGNWQINVAKDAKENDFAAGGVDLSKALTREEAAQVMFNAIKAKPVKEYANAGSSVTIGNVVVNQDWGKATLEDKSYYELTWDTAPVLLPTWTGTDDFGRQSHFWTFGAKKVGEYADDTADFVITEEMTAKEVAALLEGYYFEEAVAENKYAVANDTDVNFTANFVGTASTSVGGGTATTAEFIAGLTKDGKVVEIYADKALVINQIVEISYNLTSVEKITTDAKTGVKTYYLENGQVSGYKHDADTKLVFEGELAVDDVLTYYVGNGNYYLYPTTKFVGALTAYNQDGVYTISGDTYTKNYNIASTLAISEKAEYWLDQYGFIVKEDSVATSSSNYAYVLGVNGTSSEAFGKMVPSAQVKVLLTDGTVGIYNVKTNKADTDYYIADADGELVYDLRDDVKANANADFAWLTGKVFTYVLEGETIAFKAVRDVTPAADAAYVTGMDATAYASAYVVKNDAKMTTAYAAQADAFMNDQTTFIFWDDSDEEVEAVVVGNTKLGDKQFCYDAATKVVVMFNEDGDKGTVKYVFVMGGFKSESDDTDTFGHIDSDKYTTTKDGSDTIYTYTMTLTDGSTINVTKKGTVATDGLYMYKEDKSVGSDLAVAASTRYVEGTTKLDGSVLKIGAGYYNLTADTKIVDCSENYSNVDDAMVMAYTDKTGKVLVAVYLVDALS